jgi:hypothetical protein
MHKNGDFKKFGKSDMNRLDRSNDENDAKDSG